MPFNLQKIQSRKSCIDSQLLSEDYIYSSKHDIINESVIKIPMKNNFENFHKKNVSEDNQISPDEFNEYQEKGYFDKEKSFFSKDTSRTLDLNSVLDRLEMFRKLSSINSLDVQASIERAMLDLEQAYDNPKDKNGKEKILNIYRIIQDDSKKYKMSSIPSIQKFESILINETNAESKKGHGGSEREPNFTILDKPFNSSNLESHESRVEQYMKLLNNFDTIVSEKRLEGYDFMKKYDLHEILLYAFEHNTSEGFITLSEFNLEIGRIQRSSLGPIEKREKIEEFGSEFVENIFIKANKI